MGYYDGNWSEVRKEVVMVVTLDDVIELVGDYTEMSRGYILTHCPWHDDNEKSLLVFPDGWYKCLAYCDGSGPNGSGRIERLYEELANPGVIRRTFRKGTNYAPPPRLPTNIDDIERLVWKAHSDMLRNDEYHWYLKQRGVEDRIETAKLGWYDGWITVPIFSDEMVLRGVYARSTPPEERISGQRFTQPDGQHPMLYCPDWRLLKSAQTAVVVFGMMDSLVLSSLRFPVITTTGGSRSFNPDWLDDWRKPVLIVPDQQGDDIAAVDLAAALGWRAKILRLPYDDEVHDPADFAKDTIKRKGELARLVASAL